MGSTEDNAVHLTVDIVLVALRDGAPHVLLIRRGGEPFTGCWALPGGYVDAGERIESAARRELTEETSLTAPPAMRRVGVYDEPGRDPRGRVVSVAWVALLPEAVTPHAGDDARDAEWVPVVDSLSRPVDRPLAFDHETILRDALVGMRLRLGLELSGS